MTAQQLSQAQGSNIITYAAQQVNMGPEIAGALGYNFGDADLLKGVGQQWGQAAADVTASLNQFNGTDSTTKATVTATWKGDAATSFTTAEGLLEKDDATVQSGMSTLSTQLGALGTASQLIFWAALAATYALIRELTNLFEQLAKFGGPAGVVKAWQTPPPPSPSTISPDITSPDITDTGTNIVLPGGIIVQSRGKGKGRGKGGGGGGGGGGQQGGTQQAVVLNQADVQAAIKKLLDPWLSLIFGYIAALINYEAKINDALTALNTTVTTVRGLQNNPNRGDNGKFLLTSAPDIPGGSSTEQATTGAR